MKKKERKQQRLEKKVKQTMKYSDEELGLIKNTFSEDDTILKIVRKVLLQIELTREEKSGMYANFKNNVGLMSVLRRFYIPTLENDVPLGMESDSWTTLQLEDKFPEYAVCLIDARAKSVEYFEQQFNVLEGKGKEVIKFKDFLLKENKTDGMRYSDVLARNDIVLNVKMNGIYLKALAGAKEETVEETRTRLAQDSNR